jgi:hypothetical protein
MGTFWKTGYAFSADQSLTTAQDVKTDLHVTCAKQSINLTCQLETAHVSLAGTFQATVHSSTVVLMPSKKIPFQFASCVHQTSISSIIRPIAHVTVTKGTCSLKVHALRNVEMGRISLINVMIKIC